MFALLAMAGDLGGSIGPGIVGRVTQSAGDNIRVGMGVGLLFPITLLIMLFILKEDKTPTFIGGELRKLLLVGVKSTSF